MLRVLFIGGTGNISTSVSRLCVERGFRLTLLTRNGAAGIDGAESVACDITDENAVRRLLNGRSWDAVVDWIAYTPDQVRRDVELFRGKTAQYVFISSASAYQKPAVNCFITESTPLANPYWEYSRNKIACEQLLTDAYRKEGFPAVIVRPSHTYDKLIPLPIGGGREYTAVDRIKKGLPVISHGDGTSLWVLTHAEDFAKGFVGLLGNVRATGNAFHITSDEVLSWDQIYQAIGAAVNRVPQIVHVTSDRLAAADPRYEGELLGDKAWSVIFDNTKIKRLVPSFICSIPFSQGIRRTVDWFEADPARMVVNPATNAFIERMLQAR
ncbi:SDR family oxidoreductase [Treponema brennaborense]|uniref:NAD-dependent epimerase/dehydratase n=1 Tax=Treponema brennaborense (strain DSM 12168 / CIP 105900 / DD5/3) TaxID=906968 RepID=F4LMU0_TREBD|nr:SDR family oxidoreductase [Treponema brennaborense]AEE17830.1 NAD-dependent epimerase/dehydratase [Treponema brennaborense DSM 12168]